MKLTQNALSSSMSSYAEKNQNLVNAKYINFETTKFMTGISFILCFIYDCV